MGKKPSQSNRAGGTEHRFWLKATAEHLKKQGWEVTEEAPVGNGQTIDILAVKDGGKTAFEIESGKSDIKASIEKVHSAGLSNFYIVATSAKVKQNITEKTANSPRIKILTPDELFDKSKT